MARPLRLEFAGALYHVTSRGDKRKDIYFDEDIEKYGWKYLAVSVSVSIG
jgi:hypothetical protein